MSSLQQTQGNGGIIFIKGKKEEEINQEDSSMLSLFMLKEHLKKGKHKLVISSKIKAY
jgi:hypothetical protein